jgi:hypothetical protein
MSHRQTRLPLGRGSAREPASANWFDGYLRDRVCLLVFSVVIATREQSDPVFRPFYSLLGGTRRAHQASTLCTTRKAPSARFVSTLHGCAREVSLVAEKRRILRLFNHVYRLARNAR